MAVRFYAGFEVRFARARSAKWNDQVDIDEWAFNPGDDENVCIAADDADALAELTDAVLVVVREYVEKNALRLHRGMFYLHGLADTPAINFPSPPLQDDDEPGEGPLGESKPDGPWPEPVAP